MSFDLYFLDRDGRPWIEAMEDLEVADDGRPMSSGDRATWDRLIAALAPVLPDARNRAGDESRSLDDDASGIQLGYSPGEVSINAPYGSGGAEAEALVELLRRVVTIVEAETGLVAYDPQADRAFLEGGADEASLRFDEVQALFTAGEPVALPEGLAGDATTRSTRRWFGR